jgi:hypothetical protein
MVKIKETTFLVWLFIIFLGGLILLHPKITMMLLAAQRRSTFEHFASSAEHQKNIDGKRFWEFREFYSPGSFVFRKTGVDRHEVDRLLKDISIRLYPDTYIFPYQIYYSPRITSIESLVTIATISAFMKIPSTKNYCYVLTSSQYMCQSERMVTIAFIKPLDEMKKTNGFYDYAREDVRQIVKDKMWLNITQIKLD